MIFFKMQKIKKIFKISKLKKNIDLRELPSNKSLQSKFIDVNLTKTLPLP